jgi:peptidoglycan/xylan/chitin deacetylase (PgdA/CDA1 family)
MAGRLYPGSVFRLKTEERLLWLTFDDGPDPGSTPALIELLERYGIRAAFFLDGRAAEKYPDLVRLMISKGHLTGNHGYLHLDGWKTSPGKYAEDIAKASGFTPGKLFRPPYGRLGIRQYLILKKSYTIVFWDLMPYDFDRKFGGKRTLEILKRMIRPGSVIALHDKPSSSANDILPGFIDFVIGEGYRFVLPEEGSLL